mgnify:CR=1 FL=1
MNILQKTGVVLSLLLAAACSKDDSEGFIPPPTPPDMDETLLNDLQRTHFNFFWKLTNTANGLVPDRASATNNEAMSSIAATGFGLTAYIVGVERATKRPNGRSSRYGRSTMRRKAPTRYFRPDTRDSSIIF